MTNDYYKDRPLKNGVERVKISYPKQTENIIKNLSGPANIFGLRCAVSIVGQKPKCYFCDDENHNVAKCPVKESLCERCHQKGHMTHKSTIAEKLKSIERQKIDFRELYIEQEEIQTNTDENVDKNPKNPRISTKCYLTISSFFPASSNI
ncbi:hypothetical protein BpHYR1_025358 [Brachionus plicatilis]|uniref:CCHC-type domain-containing protein n=1 Tax=Brachionus plicatilis TaxID=10195 RepID=A0A3M7RRX4_BRAPC|nr:hypothetical protein BpHYR1_025358 [Brachionus plicatilis]